MLAFNNMAVSDAPANKTLRLKKAKTNISRRALCVRYAEVLALRQAILETQSAKPTRDDRLVSTQCIVNLRAFLIVYLVAISVAMTGWLWMLFEALTWAWALAQLVGQHGSRYSVIDCCHMDKKLHAGTRKDQDRAARDAGLSRP